MSQFPYPPISAVSAVSVPAVSAVSAFDLHAAQYVILNPTTRDWASHAYTSLGTDIVKFTLSGTKCWARVTSIYDADTITVIMPVRSVFYKFNIRISGIDACEIRSKNQSAKELAYRARNRLYELITFQPWTSELYASRSHMDAALLSGTYLVWLDCSGEDKFNRLLAMVWSSIDVGSFDVGTCLINEGLAYAYSGLTKLSEEEQVALSAERGAGSASSAVRSYIPLIEQAFADHTVRSAKAFAHHAEELNS
jgi:endonuclease YncB( thermonuclease family)